jgi:hypothetical protein
MKNTKYYVLLPLLPFALALLSLPLQPIHGQTQPSSQSKPPSSSNSAEHWMTWERLSTQFETTLRAHEQTLTELSVRLETSESNGQRLISLCAELSTQNESLKNYNRQIAERMQERDEDLAQAYADIDRLRIRWFWTAMTCAGLFLVIAFAMVLSCIRR